MTDLGALAPLVALAVAGVVGVAALVLRRDGRALERPPAVTDVDPPAAALERGRAVELHRQADDLEAAAELAGEARAAIDGELAAGDQVAPDDADAVAARLNRRRP